MKIVFIVFAWFICCTVAAQDAGPQLSAAIKKLETDDQFKHATISLYVTDSKTGKIIFAKNEETGLAPASCQKVITSTTAFALLGKDFRYVTYIGTDAPTDKKYDAANLFIVGSGDPSFGSWRWKSTSDSSVLLKIGNVLLQRNLFSFEQRIITNDQLYGLTPLPEGWIWQDIGNYYGAACFGFNWHENQYDMVLQPGDVNAAAKLLSTKPTLPLADIQNDITTGKAGSGDNGYIYSMPYSRLLFAKGTVPAQHAPFSISGSMPNPAAVFNDQLGSYLFSKKIYFKEKSITANEAIMAKQPLKLPTQWIDSIFSPSFDSMNFWFLKKSVNLYSEAFLKSMAQKNTSATTDDIYTRGINTIKTFWKDKGIDADALNIIDGSGLSPANRVTTHALVTVLQYARQQAWFNSFYNALPDMNGIKMKDGYINGVRSYTGYVTAKNGAGYTFSFIVNNFSGNPGTVREKMWKILDMLK
ncbi:MAG: D-alanyl-D-alanine carboxypeptidase/D-alanyl-D-alanine-endopeptidase [Bacteroidetes bacterium]|nr:D-alanyl-D-alanine carboxypeptidase/D-alanyl-D-alanine-endopeptidase [Bacteroidota bacterium]